MVGKRLGKRQGLCIAELARGDTNGSRKSRLKKGHGVERTPLWGSLGRLASAAHWQLYGRDTSGQYRYARIEWLERREISMYQVDWVTGGKLVPSIFQAQESVLSPPAIPASALGRYSSKGAISSTATAVISCRRDTRHIREPKNPRQPSI